MCKKVIVLGAGGHAAVIADIVIQNHLNLIGFLDDNKDFIGKRISGAQVLGGIDECVKYYNCEFIIGIGDNQIRQQISELYSLPYCTLVHPSAVISPGTKIDEGTAIMAGCVINARSEIGRHCIINTRSSVDHDNRLCDFVHVSPGAAIGGTVKIGENTHIGIGSCVCNDIEICDNVKIGAGAAVVRDIVEPGTYVGIPARRIK